MVNKVKWGSQVVRCISQRWRRSKTSWRSSDIDHLQVVKLWVDEVEVEIPRLLDHTEDDKRVEGISDQFLIPNFAGDDKLFVLNRSSVLDHLEDLGGLIFVEVKPRSLHVWPEVINNQHEALCARLIHWEERKLKGCLDLDGATKVVGRVPSVVEGLVKVRRNHSTKVICHDVLEKRWFKCRLAQPLRTQMEQRAFALLKLHLLSVFHLNEVS